ADEQRLVRAAHGQAAAREVLGQPAGLALEVETARLARAVGTAFLEVHPDPPVVVHDGILSETTTCSMWLVIPPSQNGKPAPRIRAVSTSAAVGTTPSSSRWRISSAIAASAVSRISDRKSVV